MYISLPSVQPENNVPCFRLTSQSRIKSVSDIPIRFNVDLIEGHVPSPTPIVLMLGASTKVTFTRDELCSVLRCSAAMIPAVSHPAEPPPTITKSVICGSLIQIIMCFCSKKIS